MYRRLCINFAPCLLTVLIVFFASAVRVEAAVFVLDFRATGEEDRVVLAWETAQELQNLGFNVYRAAEPDFGQAQQLNQAPIPSECLGEFFCDAQYLYTDSDVVGGVTYYYWLESVDTNNIGELYSETPESATPGPATATPTSTPTDTPTSTPTTVPTDTPTSSPTATPTPTPSSVATATASSTATSAPSTTSTPAPTSPSSETPTSIPADQATATHIFVATHALSPARTTAGQSAITPAPPTWEATATPASAGLISSRGTAPPDPAPGLSWLTNSLSTILLFVSVASFLGVLLLAIAFPLVRKFGL